MTVYLEPKNLITFTKATEDMRIRIGGFFADRGGVIMTNALRNLSFNWRERQKEEMQRIFDRPSRFTLSAPRVDFNYRLIYGGPLGDQPYQSGSRSSLRYQNRSILSLDSSRGSQRDLPGGYLLPHILGGRSYDTASQRAIDRQPAFDGRRIIPLSPNPPYVRPESYKGRPLGGVYSAALQSLAQIDPGFVKGKRIRRPFFISTSTAAGALPPGIYRLDLGRKGSKQAPTLIGLYFHLSKSNSRHAKIWNWSDITRTHIAQQWPVLFVEQFQRQFELTAAKQGRQLPPYDPRKLL